MKSKYQLSTPIFLKCLDHMEVCSLLNEGNKENCVDVRICDEKGCYHIPGDE